MLFSYRTTGLLRQFRRARGVRQRQRQFTIEPLEARQMLNAAPVGVNDPYALPNSGTLAVGDLVGPIAPQDLPLPDPADFTPDTIIRVTDGTHQEHPGFLTLGAQTGHYGEISVSNPGSSLTLNQYLEVGEQGFALVSVTNGGRLHTTNWTEIGTPDGGIGAAQVGGPGSQWTNDNFLRVTNNTGRSRLVVENGATMINNNHLTVGTGTVLVSGGSVLTNNNWTEVGQETSTRGDLTVTGAGSAYKNKEWMEIGGFSSGHGFVTVMNGASLEIGNWLQIMPTGHLRGDGRIRIGNWFENRGSLEPGAPRGVMTLDANVMQLPSARLELEIGGNARGAGYDGLDVNGIYQAAGTLVVKFVNGFAPRAGDSFELVSASLIDGAFDGISIQGLAPGFVHSLSIEGGVVRLTAVNDGVAISSPAGQGVLANDTDSDDDALSTILVDGPKEGTLQLYANGAFRYIAGPNFDGQDTFVYQATDGFARSQPTLVTLTNLRPVARSDEYHAVEEEVFESPFSVLANDIDDMPGTTLTARLISVAPGVGDLDFRPDGTFTYTPPPNYFGNFTFHYVASDGLTESEIVVGESVVVVQIFVEGRNDPPTAVDDRFEIRAGEQITVNLLGLIHNDLDPDGDRLIVVDMEEPDPAQGTIVIRRDMEQVASFTFTAAPGFQGDATFPYTIRDRGGVESTAQITIHVGPPNRLPVANNDRKTMTQDTTLIFPPADVLANDRDPDGDRLRVMSVGNASHGEVNFDDSDNEIRFTPPAGFVGTTRFSYTITDEHGGTDDAIVEVQVRPLVQLVPGRVQGAGSLDGLERVFAFSVDNRRGQTAVSGHLTFLDFERRLVFQSTFIFPLEIQSDGRRAMFSGEGRLNGRTGYQFVVTIEDGATTGQRDKFRIQITGPRNFNYDSLNHAENDGRIDRLGNIRIEPVRPRTLIDLLLARQTAFAEMGAATPTTKLRLLAR